MTLQSHPYGNTVSSRSGPPPCNTRLVPERRLLVNETGLSNLPCDPFIRIPLDQHGAGFPPPILLGSKCGTVVICTAALLASLATGRTFDVTAEFVAHRREQLLGERMVLARTEPGVERRGEDIGLNPLFYRRHHGPASFS